MQEPPRIPSVLLLAAALSGGLLAIASCATIAKDQQSYNTQQCQSFGLTPGSDAYIQCMSQGANAYAASRNSSTNTPASAPAPGIAVLPISIGIPVVPQPPSQNTSCSAPKSSPKGGCPGCSISCSSQQAACSAGQEFPGGSDLCMQSASCTCQ
jgi:hypothetical protein